MPSCPHSGWATTVRTAFVEHEVLVHLIIVWQARAGFCTLGLASTD
jgi:hypothetical protein